jgi:hypothetical protein
MQVETTDVHARICNLAAQALVEVERKSGKTIEETAVLDAAKRGKISRDVFFSAFPAFFWELRDGSWLALNRYYNVLGCIATSRVSNPEEHRDRAVRFKTDLRSLRGVWRFEGYSMLALYRKSDVTGPTLPAD